MAQVAESELLGAAVRQQLRPASFYAVDVEYLSDSLSATSAGRAALRYVQRFDIQQDMALTRRFRVVRILVSSLTWPHVIDRSSPRGMPLFIASNTTGVR